MLPDDRVVWREPKEPFIETQTALVEWLDLLLNRGFDSHQLLNGSRIFYDDIFDPKHRISANQYHWFLDSVEKNRNMGDVGFLYGERVMQSPVFDWGALFLGSGTFLDVLQDLEVYAPILCPVWQPTLVEAQDAVYLCWQNSFCWQRNERLLMEAACGLISALYGRLLNGKPNWSLYFRYAQPSNIDHYHERYGQDLQFSAPINMMRFDRSALLVPNQQPKKLATTVTRQQAKLRLEALGHHKSFLYSVLTYLIENAQNQPSLPATAQAFDISPATFKRRLACHNSRFQQLLDTSRSYVAVYLMMCLGYSNERVAATLNFHDARNFRRSFKRWTGMLPSTFREQLI